MNKINLNNINPSSCKPNIKLKFKDKKQEKILKDLLKDIPKKKINENFTIFNPVLNPIDLSVKVSSPNTIMELKTEMKAIVGEK
jgi:hypothetical protein